MYCDKWNLSASHFCTGQLKIFYQVQPTSVFGMRTRRTCCSACRKKGTLQHVVSACPASLSGSMYTWRHNNVLRVIVEAVEQRAQQGNTIPGTTKHFISFLKEGSQSKSYSSKTRSSILSSADDWQVRSDLDGKGGFLEDISVTALGTNIIIWSETGKEVITGELTVPWEDNIDEAHERKLTKYTELAAECRDRGVGRLYAIHLKLAAVASLQILSRSGYEILASIEEGSSLLVEQPQKQQKQDQHGYGPSICRRADSLNVKYIM